MPPAASQAPTPKAAPPRAKAGGADAGPKKGNPLRPLGPFPPRRHGPAAPSRPALPSVGLPAVWRRRPAAGPGRTGWLIPSWVLPAAVLVSAGGVYVGVRWVWLAIQGLLLGVTVAWLALGGRPSVPRTVGQAAWSMLVVVAGAAVASVEPAVSLDALALTVTCLSLAAMASALPAGGRAWRRVVNLLILTGILTFIGGAVLYWAGGADMHGLFGNKNHFAGFLLLCFPLALSCLSSAADSREKAAYGSAAVLFGAGLLLSQSRGAWFALLPGLAVFVLANWRRAEVWGRTAAAAALAVVLALAINQAALSGAMPAGAAAVRDLSDAITGQAPQGTLGPRLDYWQGALGIAADAPWLGTGPGTFGSAYPRYQVDPLNYSRYAHQLLLQTLAETGTLGLLALVALLVTASLATAARLRRSFQISDAFEKACLVGLASGLVASLAHNMVELDWYVPAIAVAASVAAGLLVSGSPGAGARGEAPGEITVVWTESRVTAAATMVICLAALFWTGLRLAGEQLQPRGLAAAAAGDPVRAAAVFETAAILDPLSAAPQKALASLALQTTGDPPAVTPERGLQAALKAVQLAGLDVEARFVLAQSYLQRGQPGDGALAVAELERAAALRHPVQAPAVYAALGRAYLSEGRTTEAEAAFRRLAEAASAGPVPADAAAYFAEACTVLGNMAAARGDVDAALAHYRKALAAPPGYTAAHFNLGVLLLERGAAAGARDALTRAIALGPDQAIFHFYLGLALAQGGDPGAARLEWERALVMDPACEQCRVQLQRTPRP